MSQLNSACISSNGSQKHEKGFNFHGTLKLRGINLKRSVLIYSTHILSPDGKMPSLAGHRLLSTRLVEEGMVRAAGVDILLEKQGGSSTEVNRVGREVDVCLPRVQVPRTKLVGQLHKIGAGHHKTNRRDEKVLCERRMWQNNVDVRNNCGQDGDIVWGVLSRRVLYTAGQSITEKRSQFGVNFDYFWRLCHKASRVVLMLQFFE